MSAPTPSRRQRLKRKWKETMHNREQRNMGTPSPSQSPSPRGRSPSGGRDSRSNLRIRSQQLFLSTKQRVSSGVSDALAFVAHENTEITPQNGFFYVRPTQEYIAQTILSPSRTIIDFRSKKLYRELHLRTAINIPCAYMNMPPALEAFQQIEDTKEKKEQIEFSVEPLLSERDVESNRELFKNSWVDDILQYSILQNIQHEFVIYGSCARAKRSNLIPGILHVLKVLYREYIESGQLCIYVIKNGFDKLRNEKWIPPLCVSTDAFRRTKGYTNMDFTDDDVYTQVLPFLYLSSSIGATDKERLAREGITMIINLTERQIEYPVGDFETVHIQMADIRSQSTNEPIERANQVIEDTRNKFGKALVHCTRGQSRSPVIAIAYVMKKRGWSLLKSFLFVREKRPWIGPNPSFMSQLMVYEDHIHILAPSPFPLHAYTLLESRDEDFDENIIALGLTVEDPQCVFEALETSDLKKVIELVKANEKLRYSRKANDDDQTPLHCVLGLIHTSVDRELLVEAVKLLADPIVLHRGTFEGETPLHVAVQKNDTFFVNMFLNLGATVNITTMNGHNPLHFAAMNVGRKKSQDGIQIVQSLINSAGSKPVIIRDVHGFNPIDYAKLCKETSAILFERFVDEMLLPYAPQEEIDNVDIQHNVCLLILETLCVQSWKVLFAKIYKGQMRRGPDCDYPFISGEEAVAIAQEHFSEELKDQETIKSKEFVCNYEAVDLVIAQVKQNLLSSDFLPLIEPIIKQQEIPGDTDAFLYDVSKIFAVVLVDNEAKIARAIRKRFVTLSRKLCSKIVLSTARVLQEAVGEISQKEEESAISEIDTEETD